MSNVKIVVLTSGAEVITEVQQDNGDHYLVKKPMMVRAQQKGPDQYVIMLVPFCIANPEATMKLFKHALCGECDAPSDTEQAYIQQTTSLVLASSL